MPQTTEPVPKILLADRATAAIRPMLEPRYRGVDYFAYDGPEDLARAHPDLQVIATHGGVILDRALVEALPRLGLIISVGAGYDGIDVAHARARGVEVVNGAGSNAADVAELAIGLLLQLVIPFRAAEARLRDGDWTSGPPPSLRRSLRQRRIGIVGMGHIGKALAERLSPFGCALAWYGPNPKDLPWPRHETLATLAQESDVLIVCATLSQATRHLIDRAVLNRLGDQGLLVNVSRGGLVDQPALIEALRDGRIAGAALDVFEEEPTSPDLWRDVPNTVLTPHIGGHATGAFETMAELLRENLRRFFAQEPLLTPV